MSLSVRTTFPTAAVCLLVGASGAFGQTGTVTGLVVDSRTLVPVETVQIYFTTLSRGALTAMNGRFLILDVPAGTYEMGAQRIGYGIVTQDVTVRPGETTVVNLNLDEAALALDEIVVTGTAGQARRREVGNTIMQINTTNVLEATQSVESILQGRGLGMTVLPNGSSVGAGSMIRLRGNVSVSMSNQPLIYIDGMRVNNEGFRTARGAYDTRSTFADLNPGDIERIEIVKGAAATTLYGSEAAAGVIQIFMKKGVVGAPVWTVESDLGFSELRPFGPPFAETRADKFWNFDQWMQRGLRQRYAASVRGGSDDVRYFVSSFFEKNEGVLPNELSEKISFRTNLGFDPLPGMQLDVSAVYTNDDLEFAGQGLATLHSLVLNVMRGNQSYIGSSEKEDQALILENKHFANTDRLLAGVTLTYSPIEGWSNRLTLGQDYLHQQSKQLEPFGYLNRAREGDIRDEVWWERNLTLDYVGSYDTSLFGLAATFSWGAQTISSKQTFINARGRDFPGPGEYTIGAGERISGGNNSTEVTTGGFFGQTQFGYADRIFLTTGVRVDGTSAFGESKGLQAYPKVSASYVLSDEDFWPDDLGQVKLRVAYGLAGRVPGVFDAVRTWTTPLWGSRGALAGGNLGDPELGPERTREIESGFDAALFDNRLQVEFTHYYQRTSDALIRVSQIPSEGGWSGQLKNVGEIENKGIELGVSGRLIERQSFGLELGLRVSTNYSKMLDLGGAPPFNVSAFSPSQRHPAWYMEGQPVPVMTVYKVTNAYEKADPIIEQGAILGPNHPTHIIGQDVRVRLPGGIELSALGEFMGGHYSQDLGVARAARRGTANLPLCSRERALVAAGTPDERLAWERSYCGAEWRADQHYNLYVWPADLWRLRHLTVMIPVTFAIPGERQATLTLSARNYIRWNNKDWLNADPENGARNGTNQQFRHSDETLPPPAFVTASLRVVF